MGWRDEGEGNGGDAFELDDNVAVLLDALDDAFDASEFSIDNHDTATDFMGNGSVVEEDNAIVSDRGDTDEVLHLTVGDVDDFGALSRIEWASHHVTEWAEVFVGHLELGEPLACGVHKEKVVNGRDEFKLAVSVTLDEFVDDGQEGFDALLVKVFLHFQFPIVSDTHGIPEGLGADVVHQ